MNNGECVQCGTIMSGDACAACDGAGRTEAMAMAAILTLIAIGVGFYIWLQLM